MKLGNLKKFIIYFLIIFNDSFIVIAEDKIQSVPLINLEDLSPTFEEDKIELEKPYEKNIVQNEKNSDSK